VIRMSTVSVSKQVLSGGKRSLLIRPYHLKGEDDFVSFHGRECTCRRRT
jgi:hypothetical protein